MPPSETLIPDAELQVVRKSLPHDSAPRHVTGSAAYIDDIREPQGTLHIAPGYAPIASGRITASTFWITSAFTRGSSKTASITRSHSARAP